MGVQRATALWRVQGSALAFLLLFLGQALATPLRWASDSQSGAPFVFHDPADQAKLTGFETDLMQVLARKMGLKDSRVSYSSRRGLKNSRNSRHFAIQSAPMSALTPPSRM